MKNRDSIQNYENLYILKDLLKQPYRSNTYQCKSVDQSIHDNILVNVIVLFKFAQDMKILQIFVLMKINNYTKIINILF